MNAHRHSCQISDSLPKGLGIDKQFSCWTTRGTRVTGAASSYIHFGRWCLAHV